MAKGLRDFLVKDFQFGLNLFDEKKLNELSLEDFRKRYIEEMQTYFDDAKVSKIKCWECPKTIDSAEDLAKLYGAYLHRECFKVSYNQEIRNGRKVDYFDRVLSSLEIKV